MNLTEVISARIPAVSQRYSARDTILYALGVGFGCLPLDRKHLNYIYEVNLIAAPTMANVLGFPGLWMAEPRFSIDWRQMLHGEQRLEIHSPLPAEASIVGHTSIDGIRDLGERGTLMHQRTVVCDTKNTVHFATVIATILLRGDYGGGDWGEEVAPLEPAPSTAPDIWLDMDSFDMQPLLYRLSGDLNPLHVDPEIAGAAGFDRPILHGLATKGMAGYALLRLFCDFDAERLRSMAVRFTRPVYPGDTIRFEFWQGDAALIRFRARVPQRDNIVVLDCGTAMIA